MRWFIIAVAFCFSLVAAGEQLAADEVASKPDPYQTAAEVDRRLLAEIVPSPASPGSPQPAALTNDETFLRRVSLDVVGRLPTPEELTVFVLDPAPEKRREIVEQLLADERYGRNWANYWRDVVLYRRSDERALIVSAALEQFLTGALNENLAWDEIARQFIGAMGDARENGATAIMVAQMGQAPEIAAETSRIFLGVQIQCAQCHDHPTDRWKREEFHQLAAFFPRVGVRPVRDGNMRSVEVVSRDRVPRFRRPNAPESAYQVEHLMPDLNDASAEGTLMQPVFFLSGDKLEVGTADAERRAQLARWITSQENPWFAKALVNRIWAELVGEGFYEPVDDLGPDRTCTAPETMELLAAAFVESGYDLKWLLRTIVATEAYQRESRPRRLPDAPPFLANCVQPLRADQLYDALVDVLGVGELERSPPARGPGGLARLRGPRGVFSEVFGFDPSNPRDEVASSIPQALALMNSPGVARAIEGESRGTMLYGLLAEIPADKQLVQELYLRSLVREPSREELAACLSHVRHAENRAQGFEDVLWSLINSTEFQHRH